MPTPQELLKDVEAKQRRLKIASLQVPSWCYESWRQETTGSHASGRSFSIKPRRFSGPLMNWRAHERTGTWLAK